MKRVLIVTPSFPPINAPDMQRVRMSLPYFRASGWEPVVLAIEPQSHGGPREASLMATIPPETAVHRVKAASLSWTRWFGLGDLGWRSWWPLFFAGAKIIRREKIDLVFFSNTQFVTFTLGRIWRRWLGVPYVIDLQDPWRTDYYEQTGSRKPPGGWKYQLARLQARVLEPWSFKKLSGFVSVSARYIDDLGARYPWFRDIPAATIPFGASERDVQIAQGNAEPNHRPSLGQKIRLVYTGAAGPITPHATEILFRALRVFHDRNPKLADMLQLEFLGTSYALGARAESTILPLAQKHCVEKLVVETPARIGHLDALKLQTGADALLLLGSIDAAYSPSKLYPYFISGRPMLGLVLHGSVLEQLLGELNCSHLVSFEKDGANESAIESLCTFFENAASHFPLRSLPVRNTELFQREYLAPALTARQCALFDAALVFHQP